jgi:hypothetical protein
MPISPLIKAIDLTRVSVDSMTLEELEDHAAQVLDIIAALNNYNNSPAPKSINAKLNGLSRAEKLRWHMLHVRGLINAHRAAAALVGAAQAAGSANLPHGAKHPGI